ncbi:germination protein YpeB [Halalkalibacterium ligniniphilum]|uniref:germination protein YpeB n=2 Tax=Halalkalibacterium ligniniphilum TaxID=1134413 RepID=UPI00034CD766|nr:germination protein YpeB [Halalkalibacterium ligniniphilum]
MIRNFIIGILALALIGTGYWAYQEKDRNQVLALNAESHYQRAFHELAYHLDQIEDELGKTLAMNTQRQLTPSLAEVWRVTSLAKEEVGQLPLAAVDLTKTEEFLDKLGTFSYKTSIRDLESEPLTDKEYGTLEKLYSYSKDIKNELRKTQATMLKQDMRFLDIDKEFKAQEQPLDNAVLNGFHLMDEKMKGVSEVEWGAGMAAQNINEDKLAKRLDGKKISKAEAKNIALDYLEMGENTKVEVSETGKGLPYQAYSLVIDDPNEKSHYYMDITKQGGHPIWFLQERQISDQDISFNEASNIAEEYLKKRGIKNMQLVDSKQYDSIGVFEFVYLQDNVRIYSDSITLEVALDNGDIVGYEATNYLVNHKDRKLPEPKLTMEEAEKQLNPRLQVMEDHLAITMNDLGDEVLCYEFFGVIKDKTYRIFVNAEDGEEERVDRLPEAEPVYDFT